jgi:hypothetical protein
VDLLLALLSLVVVVRLLVVLLAPGGHVAASFPLALFSPSLQDRLVRMVKESKILEGPHLKIVTAGSRARVGHDDAEKGESEDVCEFHSSSSSFECGGCSCSSSFGCDRLVEIGASL